MNGSRVFQAASLSSLALAAAGCVGGNPLVHSNAVRVRSSPPGALATSEYGDSCTTPCTLRLRTSRGGVIRVAREGYEPAEVSIGTRTDPVRVANNAAGVAQNAATANVAGLALDAVAFLLDPRGANRQLDTHRVDVDLFPVGALAPMEVQHAAANTTGAAVGGPFLAADAPGVVRLSEEDVDAILGAPVAARPSPFAGAPADPSGG